MLSRYVLKAEIRAPRRWEGCLDPKDLCSNDGHSVRPIYVQSAMAENDQQWADGLHISFWQRRGTSETEARERPSRYGKAVQLYHACHRLGHMQASGRG